MCSISDFTDILQLFNCETDGEITEEILHQLQQWQIIPLNETMKCPNGHFYKLRPTSQCRDGFHWRCHQFYRNAHKKRVNCNKTVSIRSNTFLEKSQLSLFQIIGFCHLWLHNFDNKFIEDQLKISKKTAIDWSAFCREAIIYTAEHQERLGGIGKVVEILDSKFWRRKSHQHCVEGQWVCGGIERDTRRCFLIPMESHSKEALLKIIEEQIKPDTTVVSNCWKFYDCLQDDGFMGLTVNHSISFISPGTENDTKCIENLWKEVKPALPQYTKKKDFFRSYLARYLFERQVRMDNKNILSEFFKSVGEFYNSLQ